MNSIKEQTSQALALTSIGNCTAIKSASGKITGTRHQLGGETAKSIKERLKATGLKGKELTRKVNEVLTGEKDLRQQVGVAWVQAVMSNGFVADIGEVRKNTAVLKFVRAEDEKKVTAADVAKMTDAQRQELLDLLLGVPAK